MEENKSLLEQVVTLLLKILDILTGNLKPKEVMKADWSNDEWTKITLEAIEKLGSDLLAAESLSDADFYGYHPKSLDEKKQFWLMLLSSMARFESSFKPEAQYKENFKDSTGEFVVSRGLFQLSFESVKGYGVRLSKPEDLHDPKTNIEAAVVILNRWVGRDRAIGCGQGTSTFGGARYWSVLRESNQARAKISEKTKSLGFSKDPSSNGSTRNELVLRMAASQLGVKEIAGSGSNKVIEEYLDYGSSASNKDSGLTDATPWCAGFVAWCLEKVGMDSTNSLMARSYESWGITSKKAPLPGDIVTFYRNGLSSGQGHVGFFLKEDANYVWVLGGNQDDEVNVTRYSKSRMTDIRRSSKAGEYTKAQKDLLLKLAEDILAGRSVPVDGKVT